MVAFRNAQAASGESGITMVECTIVMPFLLLFAVLTLDIFRMAYEQLALTYVLTNQKREILIGELSDPDHVRARFEAGLARFGVTLAAEDTVTICPLSSFYTSCSRGTITPPAPGELTAFRVEKRIHSPLFSDLRSYGVNAISLVATSFGRSEPQ